MIKDIKQILITVFQLIPIGVCLSIVFHEYYYLSLTGLGIVLILFTLYFFRNPNRLIPSEKNIIVSPADGKIMRINEEKNVSYLNTTARRVDIFLSLFDVHVNRIPMAGTVEYLEYRKGQFYPAMLPKSSELNEKMLIGVQSGKVKILFSQIAGTIARRIVCYLSEEDRVEIGVPFGMIRFGSCMQVFLPSNISLNVKVGDKVKAGETILGRIHES